MEGFGSLFNLRTLSLSGCKQLTDLSDDFGQLTSLENLDLRECESMAGLPASFCCLSRLSRYTATPAFRRNLPHSLKHLL